MLKYFVSSRDPIFPRDDSFLSPARVPTQQGPCDDRNVRSGGGGEIYELNDADYVLENGALDVVPNDVAIYALNGG